MRNSNILQYKGYYGSVNFDEKDTILYGQILFIDDLVSYEALDVASIVRRFNEAVDDYLDTCRALGKSPNKSFTGSLNVRLGKELHRSVSLYAKIHKCSINDVIKDGVEKIVGNRIRY